MLLLQSSGLCRFILPFLSSVTGADVYVDRHLKIVEVGGLGLAIAALASKDYGQECFFF
jgi:hypothetical protein